MGNMVINTPARHLYISSATYVLVSGWGGYDHVTRCHKHKSSYITKTDGFGGDLTKELARVYALLQPGARSIHELLKLLPDRNSLQPNLNTRCCSAFKGNSYSKCPNIKQRYMIFGFG